MIGVVANGYKERGATAYGYSYGYAYSDGGAPDSAAFDQRLSPVRGRSASNAEAERAAPTARAPWAVLEEDERNDFGESSTRGDEPDSFGKRRRMRSWLGR